MQLRPVLGVVTVLVVGESVLWLGQYGTDAFDTGGGWLANPALGGGFLVYYSRTSLIGLFNKYRGFGELQSEGKPL
jgi:hypothetical protein